MRYGFANKLFLSVCIFLSALFISSCKNTSRAEAETINVTSDTSAIGVVTPLGGCKPILLEGKVAAAGAPKVTKAGAPEVTSGFNNVHRVGELKVIENVEGIEVSADSLKPKLVKANPHIIPCLPAKTTVALSPAMREQNPIGFKFFDIAQGLSSSYISCMMQ